MDNNPPSKESKESPFSNPTVVAALITGIISLVAALVAVSPQLLPLLSGPTETPIPTLTVTVQPTSPPTQTPTELLATETATQIMPTATETLTPTATPITPPLSCLDRWEVISTIQTTPVSQGGCQKYSYPDLGIEPLQSEMLSFGATLLHVDGITGVTTEVPNAVKEIRFNVELDNLEDGEFWIALSDNKNPETNSISIKLQSNGLIRIYNVDGRIYTEKTWNEARAGTIYGSSKPYIYKFVFKINGTNVNFMINNLPLNLSINPDYLFFGYKNKSPVKPVTVFVNVSNLEIK